MIEELKRARACLGVHSETGRPQQRGPQWDLFIRLIDRHWPQIIRQLEQSERMREALTECFIMLSRFTHSTDMDEKHVSARAALVYARDAILQAKGDV